MKVKFRDIEFDTEVIKEKYGFEVDEEIMNFQRALPDAKVDELAKKIQEEGFTDPVKVWKEENKLIDGYHRLYLCEKYGFELKKELVSISSRDEVFVWVRRNQGSRRGNETLYLRMKYVLDKRVVAGLKKEGLDRMSAAGKKGKPIDFKEDKGPFRLKEPYTTEQEQLKIAESNSSKTLSDVKQVLDQKKLWNDLIYKLDAALEIDSPHDLEYDGRKLRISIACIKREVDILVRISAGTEAGMLTENLVSKVQDTTAQIAFLTAVESVGEAATIEVQDEVLERCIKENDFEHYSIGVMLREVIEKKKEQGEEEKEEAEAEEEEGTEEEKKEKKESKAEQKKKEVKSKINKIEKFMARLTKDFDKDCEVVKNVNLELAGLLDLVTKYKLNGDGFELDEKVKFEFQRASYRLVGYLKDIFEEGIKEEKVSLLPEGKI